VSPRSIPLHGESITQWQFGKLIQHCVISLQRAEAEAQQRAAEAASALQMNGNGKSSSSSSSSSSNSEAGEGIPKIVVDQDFVDEDREDTDEKTVELLKASDAIIDLPWIGQTCNIFYSRVPVKETIQGKSMSYLINKCCNCGVEASLSFMSLAANYEMITFSSNLCYH
jgi:hypothetical protein